MNIHELPSLFPQVLTGDCPLAVLADALQDCGFVETGFMVSRLTVIQKKLWPKALKIADPFVVVVIEVDGNDKPTGRCQAVSKNGEVMLQVSDSREGAEQKMRELAIHHAEWALEHGWVLKWV